MELRTFSRIRMRASTRVPHGNPSTATLVEDVCVCVHGRLCSKFCQIRPLHHSYRMDFSAHPRILVQFYHFKIRSKFRF